MAFQPDTALDYLRQARRNNRLAHAYLIVAPDDAACDAFALEWIGDLTGRKVPSLAELEAPSVRVIKPESKSRRIRSEQVAALEQMLQLAVAADELKIGVFQQAHRLVPEAANKFLKTLEEPPPSTLLVLLTSAPGQLLDTVVSRCLRVELQVPGERPLDERQQRWIELLAKEIEGTTEGLGVSGALGLSRTFGAILGEMREESGKLVDKQVKERADHYGKAVDATVLKREEEADKARAEAMYLGQRERLLAVTLAFLGDILRQRHGVDRLELPAYASVTAALAAGWAPHQTLERLEGWRGLHESLGTNVNENLALDVAFLETFA